MLTKYTKYGHWVVVSYTQDKWWLKIKTFSNKQPLKHPPPLQTPPPRKGYYLKYVVNVLMQE